jgi:chorismate mutase / prephenate dehydratase
MSDHKREIDELRRQMADVDAQLLVGLEKRAKASKAIGALLGDQPPQLSLQDRPQIDALVARSSGDMPAESLRTIFRTVYAACLGLQAPVTVAYLGPEGGPGLSVATGHFGGSATFRARDSASLALEEVTRHRASFAVLPYETSAEGPVHSTILAIAASELRVAQVIESTPGLASESAGTQLGLELADKNLLDRKHERVRYAIVSSRPSSRTGDDSTAIVFTLADTAGVLLDALKKFAERGIDLLRIQSRPVEAEGWAYLFFIEVAGHATDRPLVSALEEVKRLTKFFRVLGSYPAHG